MLSLILGPIVTLIVNFLKKIPFVANNPKLAATIIAAVATVVAVIPGAHTIADFLKAISDNLGQLAVNLAVTAAAAVATHEVSKEVIPQPPAPPTTGGKSPLTN